MNFASFLRLKALRSFDTALIVLALLSLAILFLPNTWFNRSLSINPLNYPSRLTTSSAGIQPSVDWIDEENQRWHCKLTVDKNMPFCSLVLTVYDERWSGIDLSIFERMTISGSYSGEGEHLRVYLRNRHPRYFKMGDEASTIYNQVEIPVNYLVDGLSINMTSFKVADWWRSDRKVPIKDAHPQFKDVIFIEIQTSTLPQSGEMEIQIEEIRWQGKHLSDEVLYRSLAIVWVATILIYLIARLIQLNRDVKFNLRHQQELMSINKLLNIQNKQLEDLAKTDPLTGCLNRVGIRETLLAGLNEWKYEKAPFSFILIDLDHFKQINDNYGHDVGDEVLVGAAEIFRNNVREPAALARWGGEEFILACKNTGISQAESLAEYLREELAKTCLYKDLHVTASFGVATLNIDDLSNLFKSADKALYEAKSRGRNRVVIYSNDAKVINKVNGG